MSHPNRFLILGNYSQQGFSRVSAQRTAQLDAQLKQLGGQLCDAYALLGQYDIALIVELPGNDEAIRLAAILRTAFGIVSTTSTAIAIDHFDRLPGDLETEIESARMEARE